MGTPGIWYGGSSRFDSMIVPKHPEQKLGYLWIPHTAMNPVSVVTVATIGTWTGMNVDDGEAYQTVFPLPYDLDITAAMTFSTYVVFDGVSDDDTFDLTTTYEINDETVDPVHVVPATAVDTDSTSLTIVEATHESRLSKSDIVATIAADTFSAANVTDQDLLSVGWTAALGGSGTTPTQAQTLILGCMVKYTKRFV